MTKNGRHVWLANIWVFIVLTAAHPSHAQNSLSRSINANIATQMVQDGSRDKNRLFIFSIWYSPKTQLTSESCEVMSVTINNVSCDKKDSLGSGRGVWVKPEFANLDYYGRENMTCNVRTLGNGGQELVVNIKELNAQVTHRLTVNKHGQVIDYKGQLNKSSGITNRIETADYHPLRSQNEASVGWEDIGLGCASMTVPVISK